MIDELPMARDAEIAALGAALADSDAVAPLLALSATDFGDPQHPPIFAAIARLDAAGSPVNRVTVHHELRAWGELDRVGGLSKLLALEAEAHIPAAVPALVSLIRKAATKRAMLELLESAAGQARNGRDAEDLVGELGEAVERLKARGLNVGARSTSWPLYDAADEWGFPAVEFAVDHFLPLFGVVWWGGLPKRFKTLMLMTVCLAIACGRPAFAGRFKIHRRPKILYIAREDGGPRLQERDGDILQPWGVTPPRGAIRFVIRPHLDLMNPAHVTWLVETCRREQITLLVLDTWTALSPSADPLGPRDQAALAAVVVQLCEDIAGTVVVVDHSRKNRPEGQALSSADIFGPPQKWASAEHIVMLGGTDDPRRIEVFLEGKDGDTGRFLLAVSPRGSGAEKFTYAGNVEQLAEDQRAVGDANRQAVLDTLIANPESMGVGELVATLEAGGRKLSRDTVQRHLAALHKAGRVRQSGAGRTTRYFALAVIAAEPSAANEADEA
jgi:DNA-binding transcriptional ArsR family regulator